VTRSTLTKLY